MEKATLYKCTASSLDVFEVTMKNGNVRKMTASCLQDCFLNNRLNRSGVKSYKALERTGTMKGETMGSVEWSG